MLGLQVIRFHEYILQHIAMSGHFPPSCLTPAQWRRQFEAELEDGVFDAAVNSLLDDIAATRIYQARMALAASFGGFMRAHRSSVRQRLGIELMGRLEQAGLVSTQTVAGVVLKEAFGEAVATKFLQQRFALSGRDARTKHVAAARAAIAREAGLVACYTGLYNWYCEALRQRVKHIRLLRRLAQEDGTAHGEPMQEPAKHDLA